MCELAKRITVPVSLDFMDVSSYGDDTSSSGVVKIVKDLDELLEGKHVIIVEDIIDSGRTLHYLMEILKKRNPASLRLCTLLDKPERRVVDLSLIHIFRGGPVKLGRDQESGKGRKSGKTSRNSLTNRAETVITNFEVFIALILLLQ